MMSLIITIFGTTTIWMYKEFKEMINRNNATRITQVNEKIKAYSQLQAQIAAVLHDRENNTSKINLMRNLGEYNPILSQNVRNVARDYYIKADPAYLSTMLAMMETDFKKFEKEKAMCQSMKIALNLRLSFQGYMIHSSQYYLFGYRYGFLATRMFISQNSKFGTIK